MSQSPAKPYIVVRKVEFMPNEPTAWAAARQPENQIWPNEPTAHAADWLLPGSGLLSPAADSSI